MSGEFESQLGPNQTAGNCYMVCTTWDLWIGKLHRVWVAPKQEEIMTGSAVLWGWDWWWQT